MKKYILIILFLLVLLMFSCSENQRYDIKKITYHTIDYNGGLTISYNFDFNNNEYKKEYIYPDDFEKKIKIENFTEEAKKEFLKGINESGLLNIKSSYSRKGIVDGGGWSLSIEFEDGTSFYSTGDNDSPHNVFDKCAPYFYDLCGEEVMGTLEPYYNTPANISYSFRYKTENIIYSSNELARVLLGNYKWNKKEVMNNDYYLMCLEVQDQNNFSEDYSYNLILYTANYDYEEKFINCEVDEFDCNNELSNKEIIYSNGWFKQIELDIKINKLYVYKLTYKNGDYVEYVFSTLLNRGN